MKHKIWLVMPVLNEEENLRWLLPILLPEYFVLVVDNGSTDDSATVARDLGAKVVRCNERGYGIAVQTGVAYLRNMRLADVDDFLVIFDADGSSPAHYIPQLVVNLAEGPYDLAIAQRTTQERGAMPGHAKFGNWLQVYLIGLFTGYRYIDMGPLRAMRFETYHRLDLADRTWGWNVEMQMRAAFLHLRVVEIPVEYMRRRFGRSKISGSIRGSIRAGVRILYSVVYYWWRENGIRSYQKQAQLAEGDLAIK